MRYSDIGPYTALPYIRAMRTVIETEIFLRYRASIWDEAEREQFIARIAANPLAGDVILDSGGAAQGALVAYLYGQVIHYNATHEESIWLLSAYAKAKFDNLPTAFLTHFKEAINHG